MKKALFAIACAGLLCSCGGEGASTGPQNTQYQTFTITFVTNGGTAVKPLEVEYGKTATKPADPTKGEDEFLGWFVDAVCITPFDWDIEITSDWTLYAGWGEETTSTDPEPEPDPDTSDTTPEPEPEPEPESLTIYFRDSSWWNTAAAMTYIKVDGTGSTTIGTPMTHLRFCPTVNSQIGYNYWSYTIEEYDADTTVQFFRGSDTGEDWDAHTGVISLSDRDGHDLYDIKDSTATWKADFYGAWADYDASDLGNPDAPEVIDARAYVVGDGSFASAAWTTNGGIALIDDPANPNLAKATGVEFAVGDLFKVTVPDANAWIGYSGLTGSLKGTNFVEAGSDSNIEVAISGTYDIAFDFSSNSISIALAA